MRLAWHAQNRRRAAFVLCTMLAAFAIFGLARARTGWASEEQARTARGAASSAPTPAVLRERTNSLAEVESGLVAIAEMLEPAIVSIRTTKNIEAPARVFDFDELFRGAPGLRDRLPTPRQLPRVFRAQGAGSGVIVAADGWILTNDHVVGDADKVIVKLHDGREFEGTVRRDYRSDLALVKIPATGLTVAEFGDSDKVRVGQFAIAFGSPFALDETMTLGIISARSRQKTISDGRDTRYYPSLLQTDASINPGNSGGPLVDVRGKIIGINVAINSPTGGSVGIGFAIPSNTARDVMQQLRTTGKVVRGFLGVQPRDLTPDERNRYGVKQGGALVASVSDDTPAGRAGLQVEDVIIRFDGKPVDGEIQLRDMVARTAPGKKVEIVVRRNGAERTLTATLDKAPERPDLQPAEPKNQPDEKVGLRVETVTPERLRTYGLSGISEGVIVVDVVTGSAAEDAGLEPGDVIVKAAGKETRTAEEFVAVIKAAKSGEKVALQVVRNKSRSLVTLTIP